MANLAGDACTDANLSPELANPHLPVWVGIDASVKRDSTAIAACTFEGGKVRLVWHRTFQPSLEDPLDFEATIESTLLDMRRRFYVREVRFDPYQLMAVAQRLTTAGLPMVEFPQSVPNLTESSTNLYEVIKGRNLVAYADDELRLAINRAVALETSRGWRIAKEKQSHKIDVVVALAMAALGAVQQGQARHEYSYTSVTARETTSYPRTSYPMTPAFYDGDSSSAKGEAVAAYEDSISGRRGWMPKLRLGRGAF